MPRPEEELDGRIAAAFAENAKSGEVRAVVPDVEAAAKEAEAAADDARARALDPLVEDVIVARRAMDDTAFKRDQLTEAAKRLAVRVDELKALEADRRLQAEHERISAERDRLAEDMDRMAEPIVQIARLVRQIDQCHREIGRFNATSTAKLGYIRPTLAGAAPLSRRCSGHRDLGCVRYDRRPAVTAKCPRWGGREGQAALHAISRFARGPLVEVECDTVGPCGELANSRN